MDNFSAMGIYLEQIDNFIESGQGFPIIKSHLYNDLADQSKKQINFHLLRQIAKRIEAGFYRESSEIAQRCVYLLEELLEQQSEQVSIAFNEKNFAFGVAFIAKNQKITTLHPEKWAEIKMRIRGVFLYWYQTYYKEEHNYYHLLQWYRSLRESNLQFPPEPQIHPRKKKTKQKELTQEERKNQLAALPEILADIERIASETESSLVSNPQSVMNKEYVRILKAKNKYLYDLSSTKGDSLTSDQKARVGAVYKRIRASLKTIEAENQRNIKIKKVAEEKKFLQDKVGGIGKEKKQTVDLLDDHGTNVSSPVKDQKGSPVRNNIKAPPKNVNLLDDETHQSPKKIEASHQQALIGVGNSTPTKKSVASSGSVGKIRENDSGQKIQSDLLDISSPSKKNNEGLLNLNTPTSGDLFGSHQGNAEFGNSNSSSAGLNKLDYSPNRTETKQGGFLDILKQKISFQSLLPGSKKYDSLQNYSEGSNSPTRQVSSQKSVQSQSSPSKSDHNNNSPVVEKSSKTQEKQSGEDEFGIFSGS